MTKPRVIALALAALTVTLVAASSASAAPKDRNRDGIPDRWEKKFNLSLKVDQANRDQDRDKVDNLNEFEEGTDPRDKDTDNDGIKDGREDADHDGLNNQNEDASANEPDDPDTDNDGTEDGDEVVGTIASFEDPVLTINLLGGGSVTGNVTPATRIKCETEDEQQDENEAEDQAVASDDGGSGDDNEGPGSENEGPGDAGDLCTTADLTPGTMVHEAELEGSSFEEIELLK
jgi:Bacterial TSP3 repeat